MVWLISERFTHTHKHTQNSFVFVYFEKKEEKKETISEKSSIELTDTNVIAVFSEAILTHTREPPVSVLTHSVGCVRTVIQVVRGTLINVVVTGTAFPACLAAARAVHVIT